MRRIIALLTVITLLVILLVACSKPLNTLSATELLDLGEKYLLGMDYEQALVQFHKVIEVEPMNPRGYTGAAETYVGLGQTEMAIDILEQGQMLIGEDESIRDMLDGIHRAEEARRKAEIEAEEARLQAEIEAEKARLQAEIEAEIEIEIKRELDELLAMYEVGGFENILEMIESGILQDMLTKIKELPFILVNEAGNYGIGVYEEGYLYIGGYADGQRSGHAIWVRKNGDRYEGSWVNDLPNGEGTIRMNNAERWIISGTLVNGLWNGSVTEIISGGNKTFIVNFINGKVVTTGEPTDKADANGVVRWPTSYNDHVPDWHWASDEINGLHGVIPFADYFY